MVLSEAKVAVATVADARYLPAACCQLVSTASHLPSDVCIRLFLVLCDVTDEDVSDAKKFFDRRNLSVEIVVPDFIDQMIEPLETRWPRAAYLRLYFDWIFDQRWTRLLYLDADTRVCAPLEPLLGADLRGHPIGAVHDFIYYVTGNIHRRRRDLKLGDDRPYFQSGVMLFDWRMMLQGDGLGHARRFLQDNAKACYEAPDQDALNGTFKDKWAPLDPRWNLHETYLMFGGRYPPNIMHFTSTKPWSRRRTRAWSEAAAWYRRELVNSPWPDFVERRGIRDAARSELNFMARVYRPRVRAAVAERLPRLGELAGKGMDSYASGFMPWVPRRRRDVDEMVDALIDEAAGKRPPLRPPEAVLTHGHW